MFPIILPSLVEASNFHWNRDVIRLATSVVQNLMATNEPLFRDVASKLKQKKKEHEERELKRIKMWNQLEREAENNHIYEIYQNASIFVENLLRADA